MTLNSNDSGTWHRSRTGSFSSEHSTNSLRSSDEMLSSGDICDESSQDSATRFKSTSSSSSDSETDGYFTASDSTESSLFSISSSPVEINQSDGGWATVRLNRKKWGMFNFMSERIFLLIYQRVNLI